MTFFITTHAVNQLRERVLPNATAEEAEAVLSAGLRQSARLKDKTHSGASRYLISQPRCIAVVKERGDSADRRRVVVTVLGIDANGQDTGRSIREAMIAEAAGEAYVADVDPVWDALRGEVRAELAGYMLRLAGHRFGGVFAAAMEMT